MKDLRIPFGLDVANNIADEFGTPIYIYDEVGIRNTAKNLQQAFSWAKDYKNYFAVKATPTPTVLKILHEEGMGFDCSSRSELEIMKRMDINGDDIFYTSNNTPKEDFKFAIELGATVNIDDLMQVPVFIEALDGKQFEKVAVRYNPGDQKKGNTIIGEPKDAKYGMTDDALIEAFNLLKDENIQRFGIHAMVASNELLPQYFAETASLLMELIQKIQAATGIVISFINIGGGFGVNYEVDQEELNVAKTAQLIQTEILKHGTDLQIFTENGRIITGPHGYLLSRVRYVMNKYKTYVGLDASMHNLMRPGMYGAYHHISIMGKDNEKGTTVYDVVGSLCENNDKFAIDRPLPHVKPGELMIIHDVGAHGHAMGFNYNGLLRSAEVLLRSSGKLELIRKAETVDDYLKNIIWP